MFVELGVIVHNYGLAGIVNPPGQLAFFPADAIAEQKRLVAREGANHEFVALRERELSERSVEERGRTLDDGLQQVVYPVQLEQIERGLMQGFEKFLPLRLNVPVHPSGPDFPLRLLGCSIGRACKQPLPVLEGNTVYVRGGRAIPRLPAADDQHGAGGQVFLSPATADQRIRSPRL